MLIASISTGDIALAVIGKHSDTINSMRALVEKAAEAR